MGYCMSQTESTFTIKNENKANALAALKVLTKQSRIDWVERDTIAKCKHLRDAMAECRWPVEENEAGDIISIEFLGEKAGDDLKLFKAIAPFVEDGSYIQMSGEDAAQWRWLFEKGSCSAKTARVEWDG